MTERTRFLVHASVAVIDGDSVVMVQEEKQVSYRKWNLPGGHVDPGEPPSRAAERELVEETKLSLPLSGLIGVYQTPLSFRFAFRAEYAGREPAAGDEILAVSFMKIAKVLEMPDDQLVSPGILRAILKDIQNNVLHPLSVFGTERHATVNS